jgi:hypothetical protein
VQRRFPALSGWRPAPSASALSHGVIGMGRGDSCECVSSSSASLHARHTLVKGTARSRARPIGSPSRALDCGPGAHFVLDPTAPASSSWTCPAAAKRSVLAPFYPPHRKPGL